MESCTRISHRLQCYSTWFSISLSLTHTKTVTLSKSYTYTSDRALSMSEQYWIFKQPVTNENFIKKTTAGYQIQMHTYNTLTERKTRILENRIETKGYRQRQCGLVWKMLSNHLLHTWTGDELDVSISIFHWKIEIFWWISIYQWMVVILLHFPLQHSCQHYVFLFHAFVSCFSVPCEYIYTIWGNWQRRKCQIASIYGCYWFITPLHRHTMA